MDRVILVCIVYEKIKRGHTVEDVIEANRILRDSGVKVAMHMMPGLFPLDIQKIYYQLDANT